LNRRPAWSLAPGLGAIGETIGADTSGFSSTFTLAVPCSSTVTTASVGTNPAASACTVCFPGSTMRFTPSAATGTTTPSTVTLGAAWPLTLITTLGIRAPTASISLVASATALANTGGDPAGAPSRTILPNISCAATSLPILASAFAWPNMSVGAWTRASARAKRSAAVVKSPLSSASCP
jgi:hypothetical protein